ncbi:HupE/UreJ family protein [Membranihabitans maritimus]|uniref:HupE/UreJ family protein n=1 Tax=Membranihabitans maritimus TaxID=2904244 RepID=UPI001F18A343|nr:HupE/UreJ family protein [Membranihabitans maritimus]
MEQFSVFFRLGWEHITDINGYDHLLFIITLCAFYTLQEWKNILILVTAFTLGHSVTLALSILDIVRISSSVIEFLIPVTIFLTAFYNVIQPSAKKGRLQGNYAMALFFGLIHGMGFSNYLRALTSDSGELVSQLVAFNLGLEFGQILIVIVFFILYGVLKMIFALQHHDWKLFVSGAGAGVSLILIAETWLW